ncbi:hypothetical protein [Pseudomonas sp. PDM25]|jgi:hypothetical protein|uniref:hypothetical protein n=1 Tax=Pseudomonas sp. PDM25 TaxID=2854772 RepID=UPI001C4902E2|nr:hypothetical protein [Pseudomonas sp. PDM25]MBV7512615.1 hypothetical protein [Pseudomonas sp. PDM25]
MKFYIYNFMKKYTLNFTTTTAQGTKKSRPGNPGGIFSQRQRYQSSTTWVSGDRNHRAGRKAPA